ncbi:hypothetical protein [Sphingomonas sp. Leaf242]|uniref:hypothetical protein n=1 Tax=Sphingomonas sp. Leaf242 TaxID=1736304 RepID=UPI000A81A71B|nr:hypothetical protein [Sphingomonas sp. Leaf242]
MRKDTTTSDTVEHYPNNAENRRVTAHEGKYGGSIDPNIFRLFPMHLQYRYGL